ncbi:MAG: carbohydrate ABC transporter permease [Planctomycetota bacterium]|nr:carbohydrate ABC transporter permease [Planctomycetota bacterium]
MTRALRPTRRGPRRILARSLYALALAGGAVFFGFPLLWMARGSIISQAQWMKQPMEWIPPAGEITFRAFGQLFQSPQFRMGQVLLNTALLAAFTTIFNVLFNCMAGFALAKMKLPGKRVILPVLLVTMMVPFEGMMVSLYLTVTRLGLADTLPGLLLPMSTSAFGVLLMWKFFCRVPDELVEAAVVDGAGWVSILFRIMIPTAAPAVATVAVLSFLGGWEAFLWPMLITDPASQFDVLQKVIAGATIASMSGGTEMEWTYLMAAALVSTVPVLLLFLLGQRFFITGLTSGAVKG